MELVVTMVTPNKYVRSPLSHLQGHAIYRPGGISMERAEGLMSTLVKMNFPSRPIFLHIIHSVINPWIAFTSIAWANIEVRKICMIYPTFVMATFAQEWVLCQNKCLMRDV